MTATKCWSCGTIANMSPIVAAVSVQQLALRRRVMGCFRCDGCQAPNIAVATGLPGTEDPLAWLARKKHKEWVPQPQRVVPAMSFPDVPPQIAAAATEAYRCRMAVSANRAAILLARSVIEATAKDKGITRGSLLEKIDKLHDQRLIRPDVRDGAHEVRLFGNDMAHGDLVQVVSPEDADLVLTLMREVLVDVYESPARVARAQANRLQREQMNARTAELVANAHLRYPWMTSDMQASFAQMMGVAPSLHRLDTQDQRRDVQAEETEAPTAAP